MQSYAAMGVVLQSITQRFDGVAEFLLLRSVLPDAMGTCYLPCGILLEDLKSMLLNWTFLAEENAHWSRVRSREAENNLFLVRLSNGVTGSQNFYPYYFSPSVPHCNGALCCIVLDRDSTSLLYVSSSDDENQFVFEWIADSLQRVYVMIFFQFMLSSE
ncbi:hypothetical protein MRB53_011465 [Persea americana]|uniref:Uncharacterized protein n=1 Tax=Persea americana TaxID=3435 RepID=A0ACC2LVF6_PERAE|nr:hypothetical protein MRB53_011465 [Persea americana]